MKKFLVALAASLLIVGGQTGAEASSIESLDTQVADTQDMSKWTHFRDKYILDRDPDRRHHRHRDWYDDDDDYYRRRPPRRGYGQPPPPPPPPPGYGQPPPPGHGAPPLPPGYGAPPRR